MRRAWRPALLGALLLCLASRAWALDPARRIAEYAYSSITSRDGAPNNILSLAQAPDGRLLIGTGGSGLFRFDGAVFDSVTRLGNEDIQGRTILALTVDRVGGLWLGFGGFGAGYLAPDGSYTRLGPEQGWSTTTSFREDQDGSVWAISGTRLVRVKDLKAEKLTAEWGLGEATVYEMLVDRRGTLWVTSRDNAGLYYLPKGARRFRKVLGVEAVRMAEAQDGSIWFSSMNRVGRIGLIDGGPARVEPLGNETLTEMLFDRDGALWAVLDNQVLALMRTDVDVPRGQSRFNDRYLTADGQSAHINALMEDRDGNIWVATQSGLGRFRNAPFRPLRGPKTGGLSVVAGAHAQVLTGGWATPPLAVDGRDMSPMRGGAEQIRTLAIDSAGGIWAGGGLGIHYARDGKIFKRVEVPEDVADRRIGSLAADGAGRMWAATMAPGPVGIVSPTGWRAAHGVEGLPENFPAVRLYGDRVGTLWLADRKQLLCVRDSRARVILDDLFKQGVGLIHVFTEDRHGLWMGGQLGVAQIENTTVRKLTGKGGLSFAEPVGLLAVPNGDLWLQNVNGVYRIAARELEAWRQSPRHEVTWDRFDEADGLVGLTTMGSALPTMTLASDGRLWVGSSKGLSSLALDQFWDRTKRPEIVWSSAVADGQTFALTDRLSLPARVRQVEIGFATIDLSAPERIRYRFRLDGLDTDWQEAGSRRSAFYTNLDPGKYRFRVMATARNGYWDGPERSVEIEVAPAWFQTVWFRLGCGVTIALALAGLYRLRVRQVTGKLRLRLESRQEERERIARDLHDTLLQSMHVLVWRISGEAARLPADDARRLPLDQTLALAERTLIESRNRVIDLRSKIGEREPLQAALQREMSALVLDVPIAFEHEVRGDERALDPMVWDELFSLFREALTNSIRHSGGSRICFLANWSARELVIQLMDDGVGIDAETAVQGRPGHWGLAGMRERAKQIGASFSIRRRAEGGTLVEVRVALARDSARTREERSAGS